MSDSVSGVAWREQETLSTGEGLDLLPAKEANRARRAMSAGSSQRKPAAVFRRRSLVLFLAATGLVAAGALGACCCGVTKQSPATPVRSRTGRRSRKAPWSQALFAYAC